MINFRCRIPYSYKIAGLRSYINRVLIIICSNQKLTNEELKIIEEITRNNGYNKEIVQKINKKRIKTLNIIQSDKKQKHSHTIL